MPRVLKRNWFKTRKSTNSAYSMKRTARVKSKSDMRSLPRTRSYRLSDLGLFLAGLLVDKETLISTTQTRKGETQYKAKPGKNPYLGPVVILLDEESASESEEMTA